MDDVVRGKSRRRNDKEVAAVTFNMKAQQILEKTMQTLSLEEDYACKLLDLENQVVRHKYRRFKDKVSKIKSYLDVDEIMDLRQLEKDGKMKPMITTFSLNTESKLAAAHRRLKLNQKERTKSAPPRTTPNTPRPQRTPKETSWLLTSVNSPSPPPAPLRRANSVSGAFIDSPCPDSKRRRNSVDAPVDAPAECENKPSVENDKPRVLLERRATTAGQRVKPRKEPPPQLQRSQTALGHRNVNLSYSSHAVAEKDAEKAARKQAKRDAEESKPQRTRHMSASSDSSTGSTFGIDPYKLRRRAFLAGEENFQSKIFSTRKDDFLERVNKTVSENPPSRPPSQMDVEQVIKSIEKPKNDRKDTKRSAVAPKAIRRLMERDNSFTSLANLTEEEQARKLMEQWEDLKKCRYLRIPPAMEDLSGVNTLAVDNLKLLHSLRYAPPEHSGFGVAMVADKQVLSTNNMLAVPI